jgi:DNA-binding NarL/FixJ family response regulator
MIDARAATRNSTSLRVAIVDQQRVFADALVYRLQSESDLEVVCSGANTAQTGAAVVDSRPQVAILDAELSEGLAFEIAGQIRRQLEGTRILFLTQAASNTLIDQALRLNPDGILSRDEPLLQLVHSIRRAAMGERTFSKSIDARIQFDPKRREFHLRVDSPTKLLTDRQLEILRHLACGDSVKSVASKLFLSPKSVDNQKLRIMSKLGVRDKVRLALYAVREGLIKP